MSQTTLTRTGRPTVHISLGEPASLDDAAAADLAAVLADALALESVAAEAEVGLHVVDEATIAELNCEHMGIDGATDVLSFPVDGADEPSGAARSPGGPPPLVGDVVLCAEVARRNAAGHAGTPQDEMRLLVVHSALHLCGWDHDTDPARTSMWERERAVMAELGISPPADPWGEP